jgi:hypothetical protein
MLMHYVGKEAEQKFLESGYQFMPDDMRYDPHIREWMGWDALSPDLLHKGTFVACERAKYVPPEVHRSHLIEEINDAGPYEVALRLGLDSDGGLVSECPACKEHRRSTKDARPPVRLFVGRDGKKAWIHDGCGAAGDAFNMACWALCHNTSAKTNKEDRIKIYGW